MNVTDDRQTDHATEKCVAVGGIVSTRAMPANNAAQHLHSIGFGNWSLAEENHEYDAGDASGCENDKERSPWLGSDDGLISKQIVHNEIAKQQAANTTNTSQH